MAETRPLLLLAGDISDITLDGRTLPLSTVDTMTIHHKANGSRERDSPGPMNPLGAIDAPPSISADTVSLAVASSCVVPGLCAMFRLEHALLGDGTGNSYANVALVDVLRVKAVVSSDPCVPLEVTVVPSIALGCCVDILVPVPVGTPLGSTVTLRSVSVAGSDVLLVGEVFVTVGYNHAPAPEGPVTAAAKTGNVPVMMGALDAGGSTQELDGVSGCQCSPVVPPFVCVFGVGLCPLGLLCSCAAGVMW